jgi:hypothetical protein
VVPERPKEVRLAPRYRMERLSGMTTFTIEALLEEYNAAPEGDGTNAQEGGKP